MGEFIFRTIMVLLLIGLVWAGTNAIESVVDLKDHQEISACELFKARGHNISFEEKVGFDKCYIIEDGEELTKEDYYDKHKYDAILGADE